MSTGCFPAASVCHAILPPIAVEGSHISLRVPRRVAPSLVELARWGTFSTGWLRVLKALVSRRCSFVVSGGTGSGKTTLLGALLGEVDASERLVIVEDVRELAINHPHVVRLQSRPANVEGRGEIGLTSLVRQSLRMRPDRLVVGEVRGAEVREMLAALNTGHEGRMRHLARQHRRRRGGPFRGSGRAGRSCTGGCACPAVERGSGGRACAPQLWPSCCGHCGRPCSGGRGQTAGGVRSWERWSRGDGDRACLACPRPVVEP